MDALVTIPSADELRRQIRAAQLEVAELRRLLRLVLAAERAAQARSERTDPQHDRSAE